MDNFRRNNNTKKPAKLDRFVTANRPASQSYAGFKPQASRKPLGSSFRSADGFISNQPRIEGSDRPRKRPELANRPTPVAAAPTVVRSSHTPANHKSSSKKRNIKKIIKRSVVLVTLTILIGFGLLGGNAFLKLRGVFKGGGIGALALNKNVDPTQLKGEGDGRVNVLLLGKGGPGHEAADLTDTIIVASIDPISKDAALLSIPRDFYVTSAAGGKTKINAVYTYAKQKAQYSGGNEDTVQRAGVDALDKTLEGVLGIPIHYYMMVDFKAFEDAINAVGGITIDVKDPVYEKMNYYGPYTLDVKTGLQHFDGKKALLYSRSRYTSARGDFDRAERQRLVMIALKERVLSVGTFSDPRKLNDLVNTFGEHVTTDFSQSEMLRVYEIGKEIDSSRIASLSLVDPPNDYLTTANIAGQSVVIPKTGEGNYAAIQNFVRNSMKDAFIKNENASVVVLNGSKTAGAATKKADELRSYGYNVTFVGTAPTDKYEQTILVDMRNGEKKYTKRYLEQRLKVTGTETLPDTAINQPGADFIIILGANETTSR